MRKKIVTGFMSFMMAATLMIGGTMTAFAEEAVYNVFDYINEDTTEISDVINAFERENQVHTVVGYFLGEGGIGDYYDKGYGIRMIKKDDYEKMYSESDKESTLQNLQDYHYNEENLYIHYDGDSFDPDKYMVVEYDNNTGESYIIPAKIMLYSPNGENLDSWQFFNDKKPYNYVIALFDHVNSDTFQKALDETYPRYEGMHYLSVIECVKVPEPVIETTITVPDEPEKLTTITEEITPEIEFSISIIISPLIALLLLLLWRRRKIKINGAILDMPDASFRIAKIDKDVETCETVQDIIDRLVKENRMDYKTLNEEILGSGYITKLPVRTKMFFSANNETQSLKPSQKKLDNLLMVCAENHTPCTVHFYDKKTDLSVVIEYPFE